MTALFPYLNAINMIPSSGEFTYDTIPFSARAPKSSQYLPINTYYAPGGSKTDFCYALDQLQDQCPNCQSVALVVQWMGNNLDLAQCQVYPSTIYWLAQDVGDFMPTFGGTQSWCVSDITLNDCNNGLIPVQRPDGIHSSYGGTCSDQSVVRAIQEIKRRGLKVALYLMMNMDSLGKPWRGMVTLASDKNSNVNAAIAKFMGPAQPYQFVRDSANLTVHYAGARLDFTFRRFVLHYANLAALAGGVNLFIYGSELRGIEMLRGPNWTPAGSLDANGYAIWDYPFIPALIQLASDCRGVFDSAGLTKNLANRQNLIVYSADWSNWTGAQHSDITGVFPHLDPLYTCAAIDFVALDNYMPMSDWTTGDGGLDAHNWTKSTTNDWPNPDPITMGFGLDGTPDYHDIRYLQANIERGEKCDYWYSNYDTSLRLDPNGSAQMVTAPQGDRVNQQRNRYYPGQELFALKKLRWWWKNQHRAVYDNGDGQGTIPRGPVTAWIPQSKSLLFMEYGFGAIDRDTNEENVFFNPNSVAGGAPFWCCWRSVDGGTLLPVQDINIQYSGLKAFYTYWQANNETSSAGVPLLATDMMYAWNWDARPFPTFPNRRDIWGDVGNWPVGMWLAGKLPYLVPPTSSPAPPASTYARFPTSITPDWPVTMRPIFSTQITQHVSGRESRAIFRRNPLYEIELTFGALTNDTRLSQFNTLVGFFEQVQGRGLAFWFAPLGLSNFYGQFVAIADGISTIFPLSATIGSIAVPLAQVSNVTAVYSGGQPIDPTLWSWSNNPVPGLIFNSPPATQTTISADFTQNYLCRFSEDFADFENFAALLWHFNTVKLTTLRL